VRLDRPKGNILDGRMVEALNRAFRDATEEAGLKAIVLEGAGRHFSFGASVPEHLPGPVDAMIRSFHELFRTMLDCAVPVVAAVRGQCLGGGLELASFCHRLIASPTAHLGQPEIVLGVFAPVASIVLPERMGRAAAEDLCLTGRVLSAEEALASGLVDQIADDPTEAALSYVREHFLSRSASSLRLAVRAIREPLRRRVLTDLAAVERLYLDDLMRTNDAVEGIQAFLDKRSPAWRNA